MVIGLIYLYVHLLVESLQLAVPNAVDLLSFNLHSPSLALQWTHPQSYGALFLRAGWEHDPWPMVNSRCSMLRNMREGKCRRLLWIHPKWNLIAPGWKPKAKRQRPKLSLTNYASDQIPSQLLCSDPPIFQWSTWCSHYSLQWCKNLSFNKLQGLLVSDGNCSNVANVHVSTHCLVSLFMIPLPRLPSPVPKFIHNHRHTSRWIVQLIDALNECGAEELHTHTDVCLSIVPFHNVQISNPAFLQLPS